MKAILMSVQPKWCELIASGKKTVEVRKTRPNLEKPFKCYIYCTKDEPLYHSGEKFFVNGWDDFGNGKVIGEFVCDDIFGFSPTMNLKEINSNHINVVDNACINMADLFTYAKGKKLCGWHISDLKIYDKPKELSVFKRINRECWYADLGLAKRDCPECQQKECFLQRPPQSWCYVEELK